MICSCGHRWGQHQTGVGAWTGFCSGTLGQLDPEYRTDGDDPSEQCECAWPCEESGLALVTNDRRWWEDASSPELPSYDAHGGVDDDARRHRPSPRGDATVGPPGAPRATPEGDIDATSRDGATDWKEVADLQHAFIVGVMCGVADVNGNSVEDAHRRADKLRDDLIKEATR